MKKGSAIFIEPVGNGWIVMEDPRHHFDTMPVRGEQQVFQTMAKLVKFVKEHFERAA